MADTHIIWAGVKSWADMLAEEERAIVLDILARTPKERRCPYLKEIIEGGQIQWIYCGSTHERCITAGLSKEAGAPNPDDPRYIAKVESSVLQRFCADNFRKCVSYR